MREPDAGFTKADWLTRVEALQSSMRSRLGAGATVGALSLLGEQR